MVLFSSAQQLDGALTADNEADKCYRRPQRQIRPTEPDGYLLPPRDLLPAACTPNERHIFAQAARSEDIKSGSITSANRWLSLSAALLISCSRSIWSGGGGALFATLSFISLPGLALLTARLKLANRTQDRPVFENFPLFVYVLLFRLPLPPDLLRYLPLH